MDKIPSQIRKKFRVVKSGCWLWIAAKNHYGYGVFNLNQKVVLAHRFLFVLFKGDIPKGKELDHICRVRKCCNPNHLEPVTRQENLLRGSLKTGQKKCKHGHPFRGKNLRIYVTPNGKEYRRCRKCQVHLASIRRKKKKVKSTTPTKEK